MREQTEGNKSIKRFAYTGPSSKKYDEAGGSVNTPGFGFGRPHPSKKSAFNHEDPRREKPSSALYDMALPSSPRTSTTGFYSRYSNYTGAKTDRDLPGKSSPSTSQEFSGSSGASWNQSRSGYSYSHHDPMTTPAASRTSKASHTRNPIASQKLEDMRGHTGRYTGQLTGESTGQPTGQTTSQKMRASASSSWNDL